MQLRTLVRTGILAGLALALMLFEFSIPFLFPPYLKYDLSDLPALLAAVGLGPSYGLAVEVIKNLLFLVLGLSQAGWIGVLANLLAGGTLVLVTGWVAGRLGLSRWDHQPQAAHLWWSRGGLAVLAGTVAMSAVMLVANGGFLLALWGIPAEQTWNVALVTITPFNLFKGVLSGTLGLALSRRVVPSVVQFLERAA